MTKAITQGKKMPVMSMAFQNKLKRLLFMEYKPSEIAEELGVSVKTIYRYLDYGAPQRRDKAGSIWIVGSDFKKWAVDVLSKSIRKQKPKLPDNMAYCVHCRSATEIQITQIRRQTRKTVLVYGICGVCGGKVTKFKTSWEGNDDKQG